MLFLHEGRQLPTEMVAPGLLAIVGSLGVGVDPGGVGPGSPVDVNGEPRRLGACGKGLLAVAVLLSIGLVTLVTRTWLSRRASERTRVLLDQMRPHVARAIAAPDFTPHPPERADRVTLSPFASVHSIHDGWGNRVIVRIPGSVHTHGWDLYSSGPNEIDEPGGRDDILVGEDVADVRSGG
jgi:hypothetical protein